MINTILTFIYNHSPLFYLTQSIWRDEGFSYFMAKPNIVQVIINSINDFNPPLYYLLLHFWMKIFGESDVALRMLSFVFYILTVYFAYLLARKIYNESFSFWVALFTFLNPMILYYAFELRMYSMFAFFTLASLYFLIEKKWKKYILFSTLGMYTHSFFLFVILSEIGYFLVLKKLNKKLFLILIRPILFFLPWIPVLIWQFRESANSWIYPVDGQLVMSSLGNLFTGYEGTPGSLWYLTAILSLIILIFIYRGIAKEKKYGLLFSFLILLPLTLVLSFSIIRRPIYVNRYLIFVTVGEVFAIATAIWSFKDKRIRYVFMSFFLFLILAIDYIAIGFHRKTDIRSTIMVISKLAYKNDVVYAQSPLVYFESAFYYPDRSKVFIYNPSNIAIPKYIGTAVIAKDRSRLDFPDPPVRTFMVHNDGTFEMIIKSANVMTR